MSEKDSITPEEVFEEVRKYSLDQRRAFIEELESDIKNLARSMTNLYDEHAGVFMMYGVAIEVKFSAFNEPVFEQRLGCPEFFNHMSAMIKHLKEVVDDKRAETGN